MGERTVRLALVPKSSRALYSRASRSSVYVGRRKPLSVRPHSLLLIYALTSMLIFWPL